MKKLLLQGKSGIGKSTLIQKIILPYKSQIGGFYVSRLCEEERCIGFRLNNLQATSNYLLKERVAASFDPVKEENVFLYHKEGLWHYDLQVFEQYAKPYSQEQDHLEIKLMLMDEIGGVELGCEVFRDYLLQLLEVPIPCLGVLKTLERREHVESMTGIQKKEKVQDELFYKKIAKATKVYTLLEEDRIETEEAVQAFVEKTFKRTS